LRALLIDFGSTFTKAVVVDLGEERVVSSSRAPSTVDTDVRHGLARALGEIGLSLDDLSDGPFEYRLACSSAAGGLKMVVVGLVPKYSAEAGRRAALTAGAKVIGVYSFELTRSEVASIESQDPDIVLLTGGTDGGDKKTITHNARMLASSGLSCPILVAGNKEARDDVVEILSSAGKEVYWTENIMPELGKLNVRPANEKIREIFLRRIIQAKGLDRVTGLLDILMPTPSASLRAAELLAEGTRSQGGIGELLAVEIGGATTNVYSVAEGRSELPGVVEKGLEEPYVKRTVEGDLGVRVSAESLLEAAGLERIASKIREDLGDIRPEAVEEHVRMLRRHTSYLPKTEFDWLVDEALARSAVELGVERHVGRLEEIPTPMGKFYVLTGKDLTGVRTVVGTGGPIVNSRRPWRILGEAVYDESRPFVLKPREPDMYFDRAYVFWAMGLLAGREPDKALKILLDSVSPVRPG